MHAEPPEPRRLDFADHRRSLDDNRYVYAVISRRSRGLSIGINLNPDKACNFDCPYCQVDRRVAGSKAPVDLAVLQAELDHLLRLVGEGQLWSRAPFDTAPLALQRVNDVAFAGDGEPTACPQFAEAVEVVGACLGRARADYGVSDVKLNLLTNATLFQRPAVQAGLRSLEALGGEIWAKLDAGTEAWFRRVDGTTIPFALVLRNIEREAIRRPLVLQCLFPTLDGEAPGEAEREAWAGRLRGLLAAGAQLREVQVTTVARRPADPRVGPLDTDALEGFAAAARALGLHAVVYPGLPQAPSPTP
jgi:hypothetical protein